MLHGLVFALLASFALYAVNHADSLEQAMSQKPLYVQPSQSELSNLHTASTLLISCVDFRLRDETAKAMNELFSLVDDYDEMAIPGASLAYVSEAYPHWQATIDNTISLLQQMHSIKRIIFLDHYNCGAYRLIRGNDHMQSKHSEYQEHKIILDMAQKKFKTTFQT